MAVEFTDAEVQSYIQDKQKTSAAKCTLSTPPLAATTTKNAPVITNIATQKSKDQRVAGLSGMVFEALSSKDNAWYDVASFLNYRVLHSGELEVRVRFAGFGYEDDEWVNVKRRVRERSVPLEPSDCPMANVGDSLLCFKESESGSMYYDAHIVEIERTTHDMNDCSCIFVVRYDHDNTVDKVQLGNLCRRPM
ncbi:hypothetical protein LguiB_023243 [Lonicera macranthoides]